jgi:hypothetical protein
MLPNMAGDAAAARISPNRTAGPRTLSAPGIASFLIVASSGW